MRGARLRLDHLAFPSFDPSETHRFYADVLGFRLCWTTTGTSEAWDGRRYLMAAYSFGGGEIHFFTLEGVKRPKPDGLPKDIRHVALALRSRAAVERWKARLRANAVEFWVEDHDGVESTYFSDPNGHMLEVNHAGRAKDDERRSASTRAIRAWGR